MSGFIRDSEVTSRRCLLFLLLVAELLTTAGAHAQAPSPGGQMSTPESSTEKPSDLGVRAHTNIQILTPSPSADGAPSLLPRAGIDKAHFRPPKPPGSPGTSGNVRPQ